ncbi:macro domain-containing protein PG1779-like isoform X2 [Lycorma delicatula]|uniref:macro domain-containing protein PG1779-like isoform X2 n=1 Tax=Lycorma delicatula TaxID=130591 RepID=UPI003F516FEE
MIALHNFLPELSNIYYLSPSVLTKVKRSIFTADIQKMSSVDEVKKKYVNMPANERRSLYKCGTNFETIDKVETWADFYVRDKSRLKEEFMKSYGGETKDFVTNEELNKKVSMWRGDITTLEIDAIVNAANKALLGGGGVDGAIHRAAGPDLKKECATLNGCETGDAKITAGYNLPAKYVIHTVGPVGEKPGLLESCYNTCLNILINEKLRSVAFPCISTGVYGYPQESAAHVALKTVRSFLEKNSTSVDRVIFCVFLPEDVKIYENLLQMYFPVEK